LNTADPPDSPTLPIRVPFSYKDTAVTSPAFPLPPAETTMEVRVAGALLGFMNTTWPEGTPEVPWITVWSPGAPEPCAAEIVTTVAVGVRVAVGVKLGVKLGVEVAVHAGVDVGVFVAVSVAVGVELGVSVFV
jgi:hypothetical protein